MVITAKADILGVATLGLSGIANGSIKNDILGLVTFGLMYIGADETVKNKFKNGFMFMVATSAKAVLSSIPGDVISYSHKSGDAIGSLKAFAGKTEVTSDYNDGILYEIKRRRFYIPKQSGTSEFPPNDGLMIGDIIESDSVSWIVSDFRLDSMDAGYNIDAEMISVGKVGV